MGSPSDSTVADIFFGMIGKQMRNHVTRFIIYKLYADEILIFTDGNYFFGFFSHLGKILPNLSATHKRKNGNSLCFLDILVTRCPDGIIQTVVHFKTILSGEYIQFSSFKPATCKMRSRKNTIL